MILMQTNSIDFTSLQSLLASIVTDVVATGSLAGALSIGAFKIFKYYAPSIDIALKWKFLWGTLVAVALVLSAYALRIWMNDDIFTPDRMYAILKASYGVVLGAIGVIALSNQPKETPPAPPAP